MFRPTVLVERVDRVECIKEEDALRHFVRFLKNIGGNILIVGLDEETMGVLRRKLKKHSKKGNSVYLFTWWQRILKYRRFVSKKTAKSNHKSSSLPKESRFRLGVLFKAEISISLSSKLDYSL